ncbi:MAG: GNAT family N-acetyltransferase [Planctomycetaceae bacterium]|jgi:ribosomal protein S18 acetylase RimI-like enzyme|nr:GNAT family N-acetyltransferase [Planctomycetaceae bacterium]MBT5884261.1 GNAT family N-acetyltransferase [Planctomycetaceae bacterium]MBT7256738.1 GNAT family N-acetyltransferase [Planctomycetaceae bacterium]MBT7918464.1 GNAT family N-acetyltransferase [Planctomycetaceae bacterium]
MQDVKIQQARASDLEIVIQLTLESFGLVSFESNIESEFGLVNGTSWRDRKADHIRADFADPDGRILLANSDEQAIGFVSIRLNRKTKIGVIANLAVRPAKRNSGVGRKLILAAIDEMKKEAMELARIETLGQNEIGQSLYPNLGFREIARQIYYCQDLRQEGSA